jgi:hypothetical protein
MNSELLKIVSLHRLAWELADCTIWGPRPDVVEYYLAKLWGKPGNVLRRYYKRYMIGGVI